MGLVMLVGLAAKNAILIVEFAKDEFEEGRRPVESGVEGAKLRFRPVLMTSFAFIFGLMPLWIAEGSGAVSRRILGTAVIAGMVAATGIAIFFIPMLYVLVMRASQALKRRRQGIPVTAHNTGNGEAIPAPSGQATVSTCVTRTPQRPIR